MSLFEYIGRILGIADHVVKLVSNTSQEEITGEERRSEAKSLIRIIVDKRGIDASDGQINLALEVSCSPVDSEEIKKEQ